MAAIIHRESGRRLSRTAERLAGRVEELRRLSRGHAGLQPHVDFINHGPAGPDDDLKTPFTPLTR